MTKTYYIYLMMNASNTVIYTGVTSDLVKRIFEHKNKSFGGFTTRYNVTKLVYYEQHPNPESAIRREKQIKAGSRKKKIDLIAKFNSSFDDLYELII